jgi:hypothetical protein
MKAFITAILLLGLTILHIWMGRNELSYSYFTPLLGALLFAAYQGDIKDWNKGIFIPTGVLDEFRNPIKRVNKFKVLFIMMALWLYFASFYDRG